jgi:glycosyltransferase 2 family protein
MALSKGRIQEVRGHTLEEDEEEDFSSERMGGVPLSRRTSGMPRGLDKLLRTALIIIPIGVIGNIAFSLWFTDRELLTAVASFPKTYLAIAMSLGVVSWFTNAMRVWIWTDFLGHHLRFKQSFQIALATDLGAAVSPSAVGGGFFKWGLLVQQGVSPGAAASLSTLTPLEDGLFFTIAVPIGIILTASWDNPVLATVAGGFRDRAIPLLLVTLVIGTLTWLAVRWILGGGLGARTQRRGLRFVGRTRRKLRSTWVDARQVYRLIRRNGKSRFALSMTLTSIQWISRYTIISALIAFLGVPVQPVLFFVLQWVVFTLAALIPTPGAAGGAEAAFFLIYSPFIPANVIGLATAGWRFFTFYLLLGLAAIFYFLLGPLRPPNPPGAPV